jgi:hypothetical protein
MLVAKRSEKVADCVREFHELIFEGPFRDPLMKSRQKATSGG